MSAHLKIVDARAPKDTALHSMTRVLFELCESDGLGVLELARRVGISVGMAQRITATLKETSLVSQNSRNLKYSLGHAVQRLSDAYARHVASDLQLCIAELRRLVDRTGETAAVHRRVDRDRIVIAQVEGVHDICWRSDLGRKYPLHAGAASKALLAFLPKPELDTVLGDIVFERFRQSTVATPTELEAQLAQVRKSGVAVSFGERVAGAGGIAAPVFTAPGRPEYALSVYGPENRIRPVLRDLTGIVREAALRASCRLEPRSGRTL